MQVGTMRGASPAGQSQEDRLADKIAAAVAARLAETLAQRLEGQWSSVERQLSTLATRVEQLSSKAQISSGALERQLTNLNSRIEQNSSSSARGGDKGASPFAPPHGRPSSLSASKERDPLLAKAVPKAFGDLKSPMLAPAEMRTVNMMEISREPGKDSDSESSEGTWMDAQGTEKSRTLTEPLRDSALAKVVDSEWLSHVTLVIILLNTAFTVYVTNFTAVNLKPETGWMQSVELVFLLYYTVEVSLKMFVHRQWFFCNPEWAWNLFDFIVVFSGWLSTGVEAFMGTSTIDVTFLRTCRILRVTRVLRAFKAVRFLSELRLMAACIVGSLGFLFWATCFLTLMLMIGALVFVQGVANFRMEDPSCPEDCQEMGEKFGTVMTAMVVLLESTTGGCDWDDVYQLVKPTGTLNGILFILFIVFFTFAFFNIVMSLFVDKAMELAKPDADQELQEKRAELDRQKKELREVLASIDTNNDGVISLSEFEEVSHNNNVQHRFELLGISAREAKLFFETLCSAGAAIDGANTDDPSLTIDSFVDLSMKMKGPALGIDMQAINVKVDLLAHELASIGGRKP